MGWTVYGSGERVDPQAECDRLCTWRNGDGSSGQVLASSLVGSVYYAAVEIHKPASGERRVTAFVFLIQRSPFGYKDMDESMGPVESSCPRFILEKLSPLPPRNPKPCWLCNGEGKMIGDRWHADAQGKPCSSCEGTGELDRWDSARRWRRRCWARFGGEPQGHQLELLTA